MIICFWEITFWTKTSLYFIFRGPNSAHPEVYQACQLQWYTFESCMMIHFWENTFWATNITFLWYLEDQTLCILMFSGVPIALVEVSKLYDDPFLRKHILGYKHHFPFIFRGPNSAHPDVFKACQLQWYKFQSCMMIHFWENTFWAKTSTFLFIFRRPNSVHPDVFKACQLHLVQVSKLYDDPFLRKHILG